MIDLVTGALVRTISVTVHPTLGTGVIGTTIITTITTGMDITRDTVMVQLIRLLSRTTITMSACTPGVAHEEGDLD